MAETRQCPYTDEFKSEAVQLTRKSGRSVVQVAREVEVSDHVLYCWMNEQRHVDGDPVQGGSDAEQNTARDESDRISVR